MTPWTIQCMEFSRPEYWSGQPFPSAGGLLNPEIEPRSLTLQLDSLPHEPQGKPKNTRVGSLSLLQQIFPTPESNWGLLHCSQILYQLKYGGSPHESSVHFSSAQFSSVIQSCPTLCDPMNRSMPDLPVQHQPPEFTQTHVH